jgi:hypothetical protein
MQTSIVSRGFAVALREQWPVFLAGNRSNPNKTRPANSEIPTGLRMVRRLWYPPALTPEAGKQKWGHECGPER